VADVVEAEGLVVCFVESVDGGVPHVEVGHEGVDQEDHRCVWRAFDEVVVGYGGDLDGGHCGGLFVLGWWWSMYVRGSAGFSSRAHVSNKTFDLFYTCIHVDSVHLMVVDGTRGLELSPLGDIQSNPNPNPIIR
jgi:hypothetical protein